MPVRRRTTPARRKAAPARRRRRTMGQRVTTAGVTAAAILTNVVGDNLGKFQPYVGLVGALATSLFLKQPEIAAGMAGYSGYKIAGALLPDLAKEGKFLFGENNSFNVSPSMYLQGDMSGSGIYASNYTLSGYEVPGL